MKLLNNCKKSVCGVLFGEYFYIRSYLCATKAIARRVAEMRLWFTLRSGATSKHIKVDIPLNLGTIESGMGPSLSGLRSRGIKY